MDDIYVVELGNLYLSEFVNSFLGTDLYKMTNSVRGALFLKHDEAKRIAEKIGGKVYKMTLEKFRE